MGGIEYKVLDHIVGRDEDGELLVCHCSAVENGVVVSGCEVGGFVRFGRIKEHPTSE